MSQDPFGYAVGESGGKGRSGLGHSVIVPSPYLGLDGGRNSAPLAA